MTLVETVFNVCVKYCFCGPLPMAYRRRHRDHDIANEHTHIRPLSPQAPVNPQALPPPPTKQPNPCPIHCIDDDEDEDGWDYISSKL